MRFVSLFCLSALVVSLAWPALAAPLPPRVNLAVECDPARGSGQSFDFDDMTTGGEASCDVQVSEATYSGQFVARADVGLGKIPTATAQLSASWTGGDQFDQSDARATASARYFALFEQREIPPHYGRNGIPITLFAKASVAVDAGGSAAAASLVRRIGRSPFIEVRATSSGGGDSDSLTFIYRLPNSIDRFATGLQFDISASCSAPVVKANERVECSAFADPTVDFDQATFDAENLAAGLEIYDLASFFSLELSEGVEAFIRGAAIPTPSALALFGIGGLALRRVAAKARA